MSTPEAAPRTGEVTHTPGPWQWAGRNLEGPDYVEVIASEVECGQYCQGGWPRVTISAADRTLIAAAPDLLAALEAAERALWRLHVSVERQIEGGDAWLPDWACAECAPESDMLTEGFRCARHNAVAVVEQARTALARAKGGTDG